MPKACWSRLPMGRPIKVEGNPNHPDSLGATDVFMQASLLDLYDPERVKQVTNQGAAKTWQDFTAAIAPILANLGDGGGLRILTGPVTSPTLNDQIGGAAAKVSPGQMGISSARWGGITARPAQTRPLARRSKRYITSKMRM